jgi:hypothetical protein
MSHWQSMGQQFFSAVELKIVNDIDEQQSCLRIIRRVIQTVIGGRGILIDSLPVSRFYVVGRKVLRRTLDQFTVRMFQPIDDSNRQGHGDNIEGLAAHKVVTA